MSVEENKAFTKEYIETQFLGLLRGDVEHVRDHLAPDVRYHTPWITPDEDHVDTLHTESAALANAFRDIDLRVDRLVGEDDYVAAHWSASVHHHGSFPHAAGEIEPTQEQREVGGITLYRFQDGKISDIWVYSNVWDVLRSGSPA